MSSKYFKEPRNQPTQQTHQPEQPNKPNKLNQPNEPNQPNARACLETSEIHVWLGLYRRDPVQAEIFAAYLSAEEKVRAARFVKPSDRVRFVFAHGMLRSILARYIGCLPQQIAFSSNAYGKPALAGPADAEDIRFNLAHSRDAVLVALCRSHEVGVDLEHMRALDDLHHIIGRNFSAKERQYLDSLPADQVQRAFFLYWTLKEAFIKGIGLGLSYPLEDFTIERNVSMREESDLYTITPKAGRCWQGLPLSPCAGYVGALSAESIRGAPRLWSYPG